MSNDKTNELTVEIARVFKLWAKISMMIVDRKRDPQIVADGLQCILDRSRHSSSWGLDSEGLIHFSVTSNGYTPEQWEKYLKRQGWRFDPSAQEALLRACEAPTIDVVYNIVVRPARLISEDERITKKIRAAAEQKGWIKPHWEVACLIRDAFTDEQLRKMDLWYIVTMHEPIKNEEFTVKVRIEGQFFDRNEALLTTDRSAGGRKLSTDFSGLNDEHSENVCGFAFVESLSVLQP